MTKNKAKETISEKLEQIKKLQQEAREIAVKANVAFTYPAPNDEGIYFSPDRYKRDMVRTKSEIDDYFKKYLTNTAGWYSSSDEC